MNAATVSGPSARIIASRSSASFRVKAASLIPGSASHSRCGAVVCLIIGSGRSNCVCMLSRPVRLADAIVTPW